MIYVLEYNVVVEKTVHTEILARLKALEHIKGVTSI